MMSRRWPSSRFSVVHYLIKGALGLRSFLIQHFVPKMARIRARSDEIGEEKIRVSQERGLPWMDRIEPVDRRNFGPEFQLVDTVGKQMRSPASPAMFTDVHSTSKFPQQMKAASLRAAEPWGDEI